MENAYLLQLPEKQLVFLTVFQLTVQEQGWIPVCELCLAAKPMLFTGLEVQCCPCCRCHSVKAALSVLRFPHQWLPVVSSSAVALEGPVSEARGEFPTSDRMLMVPGKN